MQSVGRFRGSALPRSKITASEAESCRNKAHKYPPAGLLPAPKSTYGNVGEAGHLVGVALLPGRFHAAPQRGAGGYKLLKGNGGLRTRTTDDGGLPMGGQPGPIT